MCNTWRNVFLQSMRNNTLSVKKLMKNLILKTLWQLYAVSEIIILIRWVTPPQKVENLQFEFFLIFEIPQFFKFFNFSLSSLFPSLFISSTTFTYCYFFKLMFLLSECDRTLFSLYAILIQSIQFFICVLLETLFKILTASLSADDFVTKILKSSKIVFFKGTVTEPPLPTIG